MSTPLRTALSASPRLAVIRSERPRNVTDLPHCDATAIHQEALDAVLRARASDEDFLKLAETFHLLGSGTRLRIAEALSLRELCVCDLAALTGVSQSAVSHQLRLMRDLRLVRHRKEGRMVFYCLDDAHIEVLLITGLAHVRESG